MFPAIDSAVLGEGEQTIVDLTEKIIAGEDWRGLSKWEPLDFNQ